MKMADGLRARLAKRLVQDLQAAELGYCLRIDYLDRDEARLLCKEARKLRLGDDVQIWLVGTPPQDIELEISPERAIEIRNRKRVRLGLLVPMGVLDAAASSLTNSFAAFDLTRFWQETSVDLLRELPEELQEPVRRVLATPRGVLSATAEQRADYLAAVLEEPTLETVGREMWRVGLIPDQGADFADRLERNLQCVRELVRPARPQTIGSERLENCRLRDGQVKTELAAYLNNQPLEDSRRWLSGLALEPNLRRLTFEKWPFEEGVQSDLESIEVVPLLDKQGLVDPESGFRQEGPGAQPIATVGPKSKIRIKWQCEPRNPSNLKCWYAEVIPSRDYYSEQDAPGVELPSTRARARARQVRLSMDIELTEEQPAIAAQVRIVGLDENGNELCDQNGRPIEGLSEEFWITSQEMEESDNEGRSRFNTVQNLPLARIEAALSLPCDAIEEGVGGWTEKELHFFTVRINNRFTARVALSPILRKLEEQTIDSDSGFGCYRADVEGNELLDVDRDVSEIALEALSKSDAGIRFQKARKQFFRALANQEIRKCVETVAWSEDLSRQAREYAWAYERLLLEAQSKEELWDALRVDTISLQIAAGNRSERSVLILPTHPLRVLWYAAYADLLALWEQELLRHDSRERRRLLDVGLLRQLAPLNCPAFVLTEDGTVLLSAQNLAFFWGVYVPIDIPDPARQVADVARAVGLYEDEVCSTDLPPEKVAQELRVYHSIHRYLQTLRLNVVNPGSGAFVAAALRSFYKGFRLDGEEEGAETAPPPRLEVFAHCLPPLPLTLPSLERLRTELYEGRPAGQHHHLAPFFSLSIRPEEHADRIPGGDVNLSMVVDRLRPELVPVEEGAHGDSCSLYGLLLRLVSSFRVDEIAAEWHHRFVLPEGSPNQRHPAYRSKPAALVDLQRAWLRGIGRLITAKQSPVLPSVRVRLSSEEHRRLDAIHEISDWVITLDRFFGVDFFDTAGEVSGGTAARKYLLDYAPEFLDGLGHRMLVTTTHREEVEEILRRAMEELGFRQVEDSVGQVLNHLKTVSGRLALRVLGDEGRAREAVSLGIVVAWLKARGELGDAILIPVDAHPELFGPTQRGRRTHSAARCDLIRVQLRPNRLVATFIEVKSRTYQARSEDLCMRIVDQIEATENIFRDLFFRTDPPRVDHVLQRARLANILDFYFRRAQRYGLIESDDTRAKMEEGLARLESGMERLRVIRWGFIVNLAGSPQRPVRMRETEIRFLTAREIADIGLQDRELGRQIFSTGDGVADRISPRQTPANTLSGTIGPNELCPGPDSKATSAPHDNSLAGGVGMQPPTNLTQDAAVTLQKPAENLASGDVPKEVSVELGVDLDGKAIKWHASVRGSPHLFIIGIPGQGKSWTVTRILRDIARQGLPVLVIDFHGQFADPANPFVQAAHPVILDVVHGLPFSPFEAEATPTAGANWWTNNCFAIAEIFEYVCGLGDIQRDVVFEALKDCYIDLGFQTGNPSRLPTIEEFATRLQELEEERGVKNVIPRCRPLLEFGLFQKNESTAEFAQLLRRGVVIDVHNLGIETLQLAAGAFVLRKLYKDMFRWGETDRLRLAIVLDEAHRLARDITLPKIMKEGRKFGITVVVASQGLADFHPDVVGNAGTKVVFRTNFPMSRKVAGFLRPSRDMDLAQAIEQLPVGESFVQTIDMPTCARVRMHAP